MSYRVPTHLGTHVPPPVGRVSNTYDLRPPWRGSFVVSGLRPSDAASNVEIHVQGIDIDLGHCSPSSAPSSRSGSNSQTLLWPAQLFFSVPTPVRRQSPSEQPVSMAQAQALNRARARQTSPVGRVPLSDLHTWLRAPGIRHDQLCMVNFMPAKLEDINATMVNETNFNTLSRVLLGDQQVAVIPWNTPSGAGAHAVSGTSIGGILIYPVNGGTRSAMLNGLVFVHEPFPDFVLRTLGQTPSPVAGTSSHAFH